MEPPKIEVLAGKSPFDFGFGESDSDQLERGCSEGWVMQRQPEAGECLGGAPWPWDAMLVEFDPLTVDLDVGAAWSINDHGLPVIYDGTRTPTGVAVELIPAGETIAVDMRNGRTWKRYR
jgi:hypothetical protein